MPHLSATCLLVQRPRWGQPTPTWSLHWARHPLSQNAFPFWSVAPRPLCSLWRANPYPARHFTAEVVLPVPTL